MHSGSEIQTLPKKHKSHQHPTETYQKFGQICSHNQNLNRSTKIPRPGLPVDPNTAFIEKYESNLADIYYKKYGHLCSHIGSSNRSTRSSVSPVAQLNKAYLQKRNDGNVTYYKKCGHISKRSVIPNRNSNAKNMAPQSARQYPTNNSENIVTQIANDLQQNSNNVSQKNANNLVSQKTSNPAPPNSNKFKTKKSLVSRNTKNNLVKESNMEASQKNANSNRQGQSVLNAKTSHLHKNNPTANRQSIHFEKKSENPDTVVKAVKPEERTNSKVQDSQNGQKCQNIQVKANNTQIHQICTKPNENTKNTNLVRQKITNSLAQKNNQITEIYKRSEDVSKFPDSYMDLPTILSNTNTDNLSFQKVTQDLAKIIKNLQQQIHEVPLSKAKMEEIPSAMIQPKVKEYFKQTKENSDSNPTPKSKPLPSKRSTAGNSFNKRVSNSKFSKGSSSSLRNFTRSSAPSRTTMGAGKFHSSTHHALSIRSSTSTNRKITKLCSSLSIDPLKALKDEVHRAIRDRKTFTVRGQFYPIRRALLARGWVEKYHISYKDQLNEELKRYQNYTISELLPLMRKEELSVTCKNLIKSKLLGGYQVDFYWGNSDESFKENPDKIKLTIINKLKREIFSYTNKQGLCDASKNSYWYQKSNISKLNHPRSYSLAAKNGEMKGFIEDFNMTAAMSLLKWIVKTNFTKECKIVSPSGKVPIEAFDFALNECCKFIKKGKHEDIDTNIPEASEHEWKQFLEYFYKIVHYSNHFTQGEKETEDSLVRKSNYILKNLQDVWPYVDMDGMMNIWILKPTASSRGRGIHMCRTLQYVLKVVKQHSNIRYVIQKYIERPLLIHNTKFDIRQWFLISNCSPLTIWMYKECYLRFSSQTYNLRKLHESIHLTNNSVQCKYKNNSTDAALPSYNMWDSNEFKKYLTNIGYPNAFDDVIYPGMKQCITAAVMMHQDKMVVRKNCFELYGADFILTEDFQPWLLEINSNPALYASTPVTSRMCPKVLEDVIKVVIDYAHNVKANTGGFEMIYKEQISKLPSPIDLELKGMPLQKNYFYHSPGDGEDGKDLVTIPSYHNFIDAQKQECLKTFSDEIKKTLKNLLEIIHHEKHKRELRNKNLQCDAFCTAEVQ